MNARSIRGGGLILAGLALSLGCGCIGPRGLAYLFGEEPTKTVAADYPYLPGKTVCLVVRADTETLLEYQWVEFELADAVAVALEQNVKDVTLVPPKKVADLQRRNADWRRRDPALLGQDFGADRLIEINLTQYTTREPDSPHLFRGRISARVNVYNTAYPDSEPAYKTEIDAQYPESAIADVSLGDREIRRRTMEVFAHELAGKFYERKVKVK